MDHNARLTHAALPDIKITARDLARIEELLRDHAPIRSWKAVEFLIGEMDRATVVPDDAVEPTLVTIGTRAAFRSSLHNEETVATLAMPGTRGLYTDAISILTPVGAALFGLSVGQTMPYAAPDGRIKTITVTSVLHQPQTVRSCARQGAEVLRMAPVPTD